MESLIAHVTMLFANPELMLAINLSQILPLLTTVDPPLVVCALRSSIIQVQVCDSLPLQNAKPEMQSCFGTLAELINLCICYLITGVLLFLWESLC